MQPAEWNTVLEKILAGVASAKDTESVQSGVLDGRFLLSAGGRSLSAGRDIDRSVILIGDQKVEIRLTEESLDALRNSLFSRARGLPPPFPSLLFVGRARAMEDLRAQLIEANGRLIIVAGLPGIGKTSVANALGRDDRLLKHFPDGVLWTSLGQRPALLTVLASWGAAVGAGNLLRAPTVEVASENLAAVLDEKKMLLMVDDVWDPSHLAPFLAIRGKRCRVIATTREPNVAASFTASPASVYPLPLLDEQYSFDLFQAIAPEIATQYPSEARELIRDLEHLPLAIHVAARLLSAESKYGWSVRQLIMDLKSGVAILGSVAPENRLESGRLPTVEALLRKSTDRLSEPVRECFACLGVLAPKPATFDLAALKDIWELEDPKPVVRELVGRGLLEPIGQSRFQMHALLVAHARSMLVDE